MNAPTTTSAVVRRVVRDLVKAGYTLDHVYNYDESVPVRNQRQAVSEINDTDEAFLHVTKDGEDAGWVRLVPCNPEPEDVIADYTVNLGAVVDPIIDAWL